MLTTKAIPLLLTIQFSPVLLSLSCKWPDWSPECGQPACPDCERIQCVDEITQDDCPEGTFLTEKKLFGCCPACVKYQTAGDICPGIGWEDSQDGIQTSGLAYGEDTAQNIKTYPNTYIQQTIDLPCSMVTLFEKYTGRMQVMQERVFSVDWAKSRDGSKNIPLITSPQCQPGMICQKINYVTFVDVDGDGNGDKTRCTPTPGGIDCWEGSVDPYPICNGGLQKDSGDNWEDGMDCVNKPCTCKALDYKLWDIKQFGEDCSQQLWSPVCDEVGLYNAVQFKASREEEGQYRWCSSPRGDMLFGKEQVTLEKSQMTCACSVKRWELEQEKILTGGEKIDRRRDVSLHCEEDGSYETLQCDKGKCWCVENSRGKPISIVVPESLVELLPCFDDRDLEEHYGNQYLRKCENRAIDILKTKELLSLHGTSWTLGTEFECDPDGSFAPVQCTGSQCRCYTKTNDPLVYAIESTNKGDMTCRCARDEAEQLTSLTCQGNGNYATIQSSEGKEWCASPYDGWRMSGKVPVPEHNYEKHCCLDSAHYYTMSTDLGYGTGGYVFWNPDDRLNYACIQYEEPDKIGAEANCRDCQDEIMKCQ